MRYIKINLKKIDDRGGTTRPTGENLYVGASYFDTSLGYNIWYNGTAWVNATGTPV